MLRAQPKLSTMPEIPQLPLEPLTVRIPVAVQLTGIPPAFCPSHPKVG